MANDITSLDEKKFNKIFFFVSFYSLIILGFIVALIFKAIPKDNQHNADMVLAYMLGSFSGLMGVFIITSPPKVTPNEKTNTPPVNSGE